MGLFHRLVVLIALAAVSGNALGLQSLVLQASTVKSPLPCHEHGSKAPVPNPGNYQCCLVGHDTALPQASIDQPVLYDQRSDFLAALYAKLPDGARLYIWQVDSGGPPETSPLRV